MEDLAGGPREQIAAGAEASLLIKPFKATDQSNPGFQQQVVELFGSALVLATGRAVVQAQVLESQLIAPCNASGQRATGLLPQLSLRNQGISQLIQRFNPQTESGWLFGAADRHFRAGSWVQRFWIDGLATRGTGSTQERCSVLRTACCS